MPSGVYTMLLVAVRVGVDPQQRRDLSCARRAGRICLARAIGVLRWRYADHVQMLCWVVIGIADKDSRLIDRGWVGRGYTTGVSSNRCERTRARTDNSRSPLQRAASRCC